MRPSHMILALLGPLHVYTASLPQGALELAARGEHNETVHMKKSALIDELDCNAIADPLNDEDWHNSTVEKAYCEYCPVGVCTMYWGQWSIVLPNDFVFDKQYFRSTDDETKTKACGRSIWLWIPYHKDHWTCHTDQDGTTSISWNAWAELEQGHVEKALAVATCGLLDMKCEPVDYFMPPH